MNKQTPKKPNKQFNKFIKEIAKGNKDALDRFYVVYGKFIYSVAVSIVKSSFLADEAVNDVLWRIWQAAPTLKHIDNPYAWLYIVSSNCAKDVLKTEKPVCEIFDIPQIDNNIEEFIVKESFLSDISILNEEEKYIMTLKYLQDLSFENIAKIIQKPISTVTAAFYRAREKLKKYL